MIDNDIPKYRKKKSSSTSKSSRKSKHKHIYKECLVIENDRPHLATVCEICGKVGRLLTHETRRNDDGTYTVIEYDETYERHKDLEKYHIDDIFSKYIDI